MPNNELLQRIKAFSEDFARKKLDGYIGRLSSGAVCKNAKEINDAVWGTIKVTPLEVVLLDSPLVQRLRLVRQLGVIHWVYPGASHSRFEHTLGVLHQSQQLITAINQASGVGPAAAPIDTQRAQLVRLCALLHDVGHGVFSHVSEHALVRRPDLRLALTEFAHDHGVDKVQLSEVIAHGVVGSPAFVDLLAVAFDHLDHPLNYGSGSKGNAQAVAALVQKAIVGHHIDDKIPLLHEIITGPFDADKLDYYVRDAHHSGVPSLLDISRLLQKIVERSVPMSEVPSHIKKTLKSGLDTCELFGLKWSGAAMLDELHLARVLLYAKIYRQKKVLAVESMIDALFEALWLADGADPIKLIELCFEFCDDQFIVSSAEDLLAAAGISPSEELSSFVTDILRRLQERDLYVSSLTILQKYPDDPWAEDKKQSRGLAALSQDCENAQKLAELRQEIGQELENLVSVVPDAIGSIPEGTLDYSIVLSAKPRLAGGTEIDRALILQGDKFIRGRDLDRINQPAWADAYNFGSPQAHLFAPREISCAAYVAAERLIRRKYEAVLPTSAVELSKQEKAQITALKRKLEAKGWYSGIPVDIRPTPERLEMADIDERVQKLAVRLETIDEPKGAIAPRRAPGMQSRILGWLSQFRTDASIECALEAIEALKILSREDNYAALRNFIDTHPEFKGATICPLGDLKDSGAVQAYLSRDLEAIFPIATTVDHAAERGGSEPLVFVDDFIGSGRQVSNMIGGWFDENELKDDALGEVRLPFNQKERDHLTSRPVAFVFVSGWNEGLEKVGEAAKKVGINATVYAHLRDPEIPFAFTRADEDGRLEGFKEHCRQIGESLLKSNGKSAEKQKERALGYGNRGMLLATRLNVPTQTLTCIWMDGKYDDVDWHALIRRRTKK